jgi:hypothetical protein
MTDWFPDSLSFDWGSFLGGTIAGIVAVSLFLIQRFVDRREIQRKRLSHVREFCVRSISKLNSMTRGEFEPGDDEKGLRPTYIGFGGRVRLIRERYDNWDDLNEDAKQRMRIVASDGVEFIRSGFERLHNNFEKVIVGAEAPIAVSNQWIDVIEEIEDLARGLTAVQMDYQEAHWITLDDHGRKESLSGIWLLDEHLSDLRTKLSKLKDLCEQG